MLMTMPDGTVFATGTGLFLDVAEEEIRWVAVRGSGYYDWTIYYHKVSMNIDFITRNGDKLFNEKTIKRFVPCDEDAWKLYRM